MHRAKTILICIITVAKCMYAQSQVTGPVYRLEPNTKIHNLYAYTQVLVDSLYNHNKDILSGKLDKEFVPLSGISKSISANTYWLRFSIRATVDTRRWWLLLRDSNSTKTSTSENCYVDVYFTDTTRKVTRHERTGIFVPRAQKSVRYNAAFTGVWFSANADKTATVYIKVHNEFGVEDTNGFSYPQLHDPVVALGSGNFTNQAIVLSTIALVFSVISFFFFFFVKERSYLFFALYTLALSQHYLILHSDLPFIDLYIPEHPFLVIPAFTMLTIGNLIFFFLFGKFFFNLKALSFKTDKWLVWFLVALGAITITETLLEISFRRYVLNPYIGYLFVPLALCFIIRFAFFRSVLARIYVAGATWLICFTILGFLWETVWPSFPFNPWPVGQVGQLLIFTAGLAYKIRLNEKARAEAARIKDMDTIKSRFFANISHEFRTPLTLIQGPLQQIEDIALKNEGTVAVPVRQIKTMRRNTDRLLELVNQLLDLSRLDSGKMTLKIIRGDVLQLLKTLTASFESMAERNGIHYHIHFPQQTQIVFFDKDKLEKIFSNLLTNAFKYTPGQGTVSVEADIIENRLRLSVEDNGPGIPRKELDKIFDRFYQVESNEQKGSGLGLALVKELVDLYRGQIIVSSEPGKGTRFKVSLPVEKISFEENEFVYGDWEPEQTFINRLTPERSEVEINKENQGSQLPLLLIVEDNNDLRDFIKETVQRNYQVIEAPNGKKGLEEAIIEIPDIIVSDVMMPVMDGFAMTAKLKKDERTSHIPIILLTAKAGQQHKIEGLETGADDYLTKPFDAKELLARIQNLIDQRKLLRKKFAGEIFLRPSEIAVTSADDIFLHKVLDAIESNMSDENFGVEALAKEVAMSRSQLHRKLIALTGKSPSEILRNTRLIRAKELLQKKAASPSEVAWQVGFNSHTYFSKCFKEEFGITPSEVEKDKS